MKSSYTKPTLLLDQQRALKNIQTMAEKARRNRVRFRPHFKTHQSARIGEWYREFGVETITVSSVSMATYFAEHGWDDITIAFPVNLLEIDAINKLAGRIKLNLLVESIESVRFLAGNLQAEAHAWIKIDVGYHRAGIPNDDFEAIQSVCGEIRKSPLLKFEGILTHAGHTYEAKSKDEIEFVYQSSVTKLNKIREQLYSANFENMEISVGDTPACSIVDDFGDVDEIRPGNFVFYDVMQLGIGSCTEDQIATSVACPVVAKHRERNEILLYGGAIHFSKDYVLDDGKKIYGKISPLGEKGWGAIAENTYLAKISQEHGTVKTNELFFDKVNIGDILVVLPVHSCLTANLMGEYMTLDGERIPMMRYEF
jgi:D-serine deaminase-like pyridoxal phosphate-dependent protein